MKNELQIPCFRELSDWPTVPALPFRISHFGRYRDGGPQGGTYAIDLVDSAGAKFPFFFDRFLGRLCYGGNFECGDDAAFIKKGSKLQMELF